MSLPGLDFFRLGGDDWACNPPRDPHTLRQAQRPVSGESPLLSGPVRENPPGGVVSFWVAGEPVTQGSMRGLWSRKRGHVVMPQSRRLLAWREAVAWAAQGALAPRRDRRGVGGAPLGGACVAMAFVLRRPPSVRRRLPFAKPDLDKLVRAVFDGLSGAVLRDDAQVVACVAWKRYGREPGVLVSVCEA